jgi:hypothetical protein
METGVTQSLSYCRVIVMFDARVYGGPRSALAASQPWLRIGRFRCEMRSAKPIELRRAAPSFPIVPGLHQIDLDGSAGHPAQPPRPELLRQPDGAITER